MPDVTNTVQPCLFVCFRTRNPWPNNATCSRQTPCWWWPPPPPPCPRGRAQGTQALQDLGHSQANILCNTQNVKEFWNPNTLVWHITSWVWLNFKRLALLTTFVKDSKLIPVAKYFTAPPGNMLVITTTTNTQGKPWLTSGSANLYYILFACEDPGHHIINLLSIIINHNK